MISPERNDETSEPLQRRAPEPETARRDPANPGNGSQTAHAPSTATATRDTAQQRFGIGTDRWNLGGYTTGVRSAAHTGFPHRSVSCWQRCGCRCSAIQTWLAGGGAKYLRVAQHPARAGSRRTWRRGVGAWPSSRRRSGRTRRLVQAGPAGRSRLGQVLWRPVAATHRCPLLGRDWPEWVAHGRPIHGDDRRLHGLCLPVALGWRLCAIQRPPGRMA
jgi:hypothetical protein